MRTRFPEYLLSFLRLLARTQPSVRAAKAVHSGDSRPVSGRRQEPTNFDGVNSITGAPGMNRGIVRPGIAEGRKSSA